MRKKIPLLLIGVVLAATASAEKAGLSKFNLPGFFEFQVAGDWGEAKFNKNESKAVLYQQGNAESKDGNKTLVFATMQVLDPTRIKNPALQKVDAAGIANFMFQSMKFTGEGKDAVKPETEIVDLKDAGPAENYFRLAEPGGAGKVFLSGISMKGKNGAHAILIIEKKTGTVSPRDKAFWRKVAKTLRVTK